MYPATPFSSPLAQFSQGLECMNGCMCGGEEEVPLKASAVGKSLYSFYGLSICRETKATSAELPKC